MTADEMRAQARSWERGALVALVRAEPGRRGAWERGFVVGRMTAAKTLRERAAESEGFEVGSAPRAVQVTR